MLLDAGRLVREKRMVACRQDVLYKDDGSPATRLEADIELLLRDRLAKFEPSAVVIGEETGGALSRSGFEIAIDPVDGTWAFLSGTETYTTTLAVFRDGVPILGMISNPTTGEIGYATVGGDSRLVQLSVFGESDRATSLPEYEDATREILVNFHPSRTWGSVVGGLYDAWRERGVRMVRSPGGSPSWALVEAARGAFVYLNMWSKRPAEPYDLAPGVLLVRNAGGEVTDLEGKPIDMLSHAGPFVASVHDHAREKVAEIARNMLTGGEE
jgi:fructose-1,6-bisphosphatase/inositol monophosphatase family enzyme